jgi:iron complex outermembrane receptor protein
MSSSSFGSAFMVWGEMPIEYIDHIEVFKVVKQLQVDEIQGFYLSKPLKEIKA